MRQTRRTQEIWTLVFQDRTTKGHCITIRQAARIQMIQDKSQGWGQEETNANNRIHILNMCNRQQPLMKNPPSRTQTVTQTHDLSLWSAEPTRGSEKQLVKKSTKPRPKKHTPTSQKELARLDSSDLASSLWN